MVMHRLWYRWYMEDPTSELDVHESDPSVNPLTRGLIVIFIAILILIPVLLCCFKW